jgi:nitroreductase
MWRNVRVYGRILKAAIGFFYDLQRFIKYTAWKGDMWDMEVRNFHMVEIYHSLEKSISFKKRDKSSGWNTAFSVLALLKIAKESGDIGYHDRAGFAALNSFISLSENENNPQTLIIKQELLDIDFDVQESHGAKDYLMTDFYEGKLDNPESFFNSRYSLREFKDGKVHEGEIKRAVTLAMKTPSVCNRQAWHVYHSNQKSVVQKALSFQQGNRGFGESVHDLMLITTDLKAFVSGQERYQHWIDGGLFSMSVIYALHSIGIASCCLNWSQSPANDQKLRACFDIQPNHTIIMMLAIGYPDDHNKVCISARRPFEEIYSDLKLT